jgi:Arc/MetJ-type ribon-helix-helix transcriptional regulator
MRIAKTISITLPPDLLLKAQETAEREHRTMSELLREALRRYMSNDPSTKLERWNALREQFRDTATELGISSDADIERMSDEYRAGKRR